MDKQQSSESEGMRAVTISREYGSGGGEVAARLAQRLGWQLIDHEVVVEVARELGIAETEAAARDEQVESFVSRLLSAMTSIEPAIPVASPASPAADAPTYLEALRRVFETAVQAGKVVIVGRGGQVLLAKRRDTLHLRIVAPLNRRVQYVTRREGLDEAAARTRVQLKDRERIRYMQALHHCHPDDSHWYDLVVNTAILDLETAVDLACRALDGKARKLSLSEDELGPKAGLARYVEQPDDISGAHP